MNRAEFEEMSEYAWEELYEEFLNDVYDTVTIAGYEYDHGRAARMVDPIAFRVGVSDYMSSIEADLEEDDA